MLCGVFGRTSTVHFRRSSSIRFYKAYDAFMLSGPSIATHRMLAVGSPPHNNALRIFFERDTQLRIVTSSGAFTILTHLSQYHQLQTHTNNTHDIPHNTQHTTLTAEHTPSHQRPPHTITNTLAFVREVLLYAPDQSLRPLLFKGRRMPELSQRC